MLYYQANISTSQKRQQGVPFVCVTLKTLVGARAGVKDHLVRGPRALFLLHSRSYTAAALSIPPSVSLTPTHPSFPPSLPLWTQIQSVIWSPCNGRVIGTLPWLVGNLGELCTGAICNIFSKLNSFSSSLTPLLSLVPSAALNSNGLIFFFSVSQISVLTFLFFSHPPLTPPPPFIQCILPPAPFFSLSPPP